MIERLPHSDGLPLPSAATSGAAGVDLMAAVQEPVVIPPGGRALVPTGFAVALPVGHEWQIRPRSGLALKHGVTVLNAPGTIDEDYRGEVGVILLNAGAKAFEVTRGMRIAQAVLAPVVRQVLVETNRLPISERGAGGFGSTGVGA
ncbi:dUTP diphosphatase [Rhodovarius crocodyli]|uniref:Deoxyuridine 5'-triphosphate nucleotidohydrolase n=1 Tax=Rhodovarius crocodyli TaxID=1979269 RepID=A0A437MEY7_9PROT|nr:dUTP diphosphatase [Rhodovarius crocodyli]RVT96218.1 dUTP diphosphatase [Rhodovarius crocodyli]